MGEREFDLENEIGLKPIKIDLYSFTPYDKNPSPIIFLTESLNKFRVLINQKHSLLRDFSDSGEDLLLIEIAGRFHELVADRESWTLTRIYSALKHKYMADSILNINTMVEAASDIMREIQNHFVSKDYKLSPWPSLGATEISKLKENYLKMERKDLGKTTKLTHSSRFVKYMDRRYLFGFIKSYPELIFDDEFFSLPYKNLESLHKEDQLQTYLGYFNDLRWILYELQEMGDEYFKENKQSMIRSSYSLKFFNENRTA